MDNTKQIAAFKKYGYGSLWFMAVHRFAEGKNPPAWWLHQVNLMFK